MLQVEPRPGPRALERTLHRRPADPAAELSVDNMKRRKDTSELYLGERGIEKIDGAQMATFANLAVLWLNDNKLTKLKGLDANFRLTALYLQNNRISSISSPSCSLPALRFLETLLLQNNEITDLSATLGALERLPRLSTLNLFGNPVAEETNYRPTTVHRLKALQVFDQHAVTHAERQHADELFSAERIRRRYAFGQRTEPWERPEVQPRYSLSATEKMLRGETERVRARQRAREAAAEHEAQYSAQLPTFQLAIKDRSAPAGMRTERVAVPPKGHTPCICASIGVMRCADGLLPLVRAADATHVFLTCELWGIPAAPIRTEPADLRALGTGEIDFKLARIVTSGREAEAYEVILSKAYVRRPTGREYRTRLELFALERDGVDSKHPIATGTVDLVQLFSGERVDGRTTHTVQLRARERGAPVVAEVQVAFEVAWSPFTTMPERPSLRRAGTTDEREKNLTGDLTFDSLSYFLREEAREFRAAGSSGDAEGGVDTAGVRPALSRLGCRPTAEDLETLTAPLPERAEPKELAASLGNAKEGLYEDAQRRLMAHIASGSTEPVDREIWEASLRALRLHQDTDVPPPPPPARIRHRTATSHDMLATVTLKTLADVEREQGGFLPMVNLPRGEIRLDERRYRAHELRKKQGVLAEAKPTVMSMSSILAATPGGGAGSHHQHHGAALSKT